MTARRPSASEREASEHARIVTLVSTGAACTRGDLVRATGLARSTVSQRVDGLLSAGLLAESGNGESTGGRRPVLLSLNPQAGVVLAADIGVTHCRLAMADLSANVSSERSERLEVARGPDHVLGWVTDGFHALIAEAGVDSSDVGAIGIGVPGPVEFATGRVVKPPIMPGWDGVIVPDRFADHFDAPVLVDNDVNIMALGESWGRRSPDEELLFVKVGSGIGCGIMSGDVIHRGADGAAGDIGHIRVAGAEGTVCVCGNTGCLEAVASGSALVRELSSSGLDVSTARDIIRLAQAGDSRVVRSVRVAGQRIGEVLASIVNFYNPDCIVVGGALAELHDDLLAGIRSVVYQRALPLATRELSIELSALEGRAGIQGAAVLAARTALSPAGVSRWLAAASTPGRLQRGSSL